MESKFKLGKVFLVVVLALVTPLLPFALTRTTLNLTDKIYWSIFFLAVLILSIAFVWYSFLTQLVKIKISDGKIHFKNIITRKKFEIFLKDIEDARISIWTGFILIKTSETMIRIHPDYYKNGWSIADKILKLVQ